MGLHLQYRMRRKFVLEHVENLRSRINQRGTSLCSAEGALTYLAPRIHFPTRQKALGWEPDTDLLWAKCRASLEPQVPESVRGDAGGGVPAFPPEQGRVPLPPVQAPSGFYRGSPLTGSGYLSSAPGPRPPEPPDLPAHRPGFPVPAASLRSAWTRGGDREWGGRPGWGAGQSRRASRRGRERAPPLLSGTCQCFALGAGTRLGVLPLRPWDPGAPCLRRFRRVRSALRASQSSPRQRPARAAGWGPGQGEGSRGPLARHWLIFYSVDMFSYC